jgi:urease gamma subunit
MIFVASEMAKKRRARPEVELAGAMAILSAGILEAARDG